MLQTSDQEQVSDNSCSAPEAAVPDDPKGFPGLVHREEQVNPLVAACSIPDLSEIMTSCNFTF